MASWNGLRSFIESNFKLMDHSTDTFLRMVFAFDDGRTQLCLVALKVQESDGEEWVAISSPIGPVAKINVARAAEMAFDIVCGGIVVIGDLAYLHHSAPLLNLDTNEFHAATQRDLGPGG
jgi:hypothetical protein